MLKVLDLFSGIGGFSLGLERTGGFETVAFCEIEKFPQKVLAKHWPRVPIYNDVMELTNDRLRADGIFPDIITGGFPCQDISVAGNQKGIDEGTRSGLWSECARLVGEIRPDYAIFENVTALLSGESGKWFERVLWDLSEVGYDAEWHCIPASELGAHHHRDRVWIICHPQKLQRNGGNTNGEDGKCKIPEFGNTSSERDMADTSSRGSDTIFSDTNSKRGCGGNASGENASDVRQSLVCQRKHLRRMEIWNAEPNVDRVANGIPDRTHRLKGLGNAICPPISELIGRAILETEDDNS